MYAAMCPWNSTSDARQRNHFAISSYNQYMIRAMLFALLPVCALAADLTGSWNFHMIRFGEEFAGARIELKSEGTKVTGTLNELKLAGESQGNDVHITLTRPNGSEWGKIDGTI